MHKILLTGATGYIGKRLLHRLLQERAETFLIPVRASSTEDFNLRKEQMLRSVPEKAQARLEIIHSDLTELPKKLQPYLGSISVIIHNAAKTAFNVDEKTANSDNRDASIALLEMATKCTNLESFVYVSTLYASGMTAGPIKEEFFSQPQFANHYERSKWEVENTIREKFSSLPWRIARVATIISDNSQGKVIQHNAIHNTLKLFYYGLISLLPGKTTTPIHLVDGDFVTDALAAVVNKGSSQGIYHVCYDQAGSITLGRLIDVAFEEFSKDENFKSRRLLKPLFTDESTFETLVANVKGFGGSVLNQGLSSISPFGRQLFIAKEVNNTALVNLLGNYSTPATENIIRKTCSYLAESKFAKNQGDS